MFVTYENVIFASLMIFLMICNDMYVCMYVNYQASSGPKSKMYLDRLLRTELEVATAVI